MKTSDRVWQVVKEAGITDIFMLPGGGACHLVDSLGQSGLNIISASHEQSAGYEALSYAMYRGLGVCLVTSGPGVTNCITPITAAWMDSVPLLVIAGQAPSNLLIGNSGLRTRGPQEINAVELIHEITKCSYQPLIGQSTIFTLERMIHLCTTPRFGPCLISIPQDVQAQEVNYA